MPSRTDNMILSTPDYYQYSAIFREIQAAIALDLDANEGHNPDIVTQLYIPTATWGLRYWEQILGIVMVDAESYDTRRSRVLAKWRGIGNFSAALIKSIASAFTGEQVNVLVVISEFLVVIEIPELMPNQLVFRAEVDNIIHAHLGVRYRTKYHFTASMPVNHVVNMELTISTALNFWCTDPKGVIRWNSAINFNGTANWDAGSVILNQQHNVKIYPVVREESAFTEVTQLWDGTFDFSGGRTFGDFTPESCCNQALKIRTVKNGIEQGAVLV